MQFIPFCLFTIICGYSLVMSAPVNQKTPDSQETKQHKATVIASRLLKELAGEQIASHHTEESTNKDQNKDAIKPVNHPGTEKVESHIETPNDDDEEIEFTPTIEDLYEIYANQYPQQLLDNEESSSESAEEDYILPISKQQLMRYLAEQQESEEHLVPAVHKPIMDDTIMTAENHRRRRSIY